MDIGHQPVAGIGVTFRTMMFEELGKATTTASGEAEISYTRLAPTSDIVRAEYFDGICCFTSSDDLIIDWVAAAPPPGPSGPFAISLFPTGTIDDRGIYATWLTFVFGAIAVDLGGFPGSVGLDIERLGPVSTGFVFSGSYPGLLPLLAPGEYRVTVTPPPGFEVTPTSVDIFVICKATTPVQFQLEALPPPPSDVDPRTIGYWKNHQGHIQDLIDDQPIGGLTVAEIVDILRNANAKDARNALRAQRMATVLNLRNGTDPGGILVTVIDARAFLMAHSGDPVTRKHPDRDEALDMKDLLDAYNNSGE